MEHTYADEATSAEDLVRINNLVLELTEVRSDIDHIEERLAAARAVERRLATEQLPEIMLELGHRRPIDLPCGLKVQIVDEVKSSISRANQEAAFRWLDENGHGGMIKREVVVSFSKDQQKDALELAKEIDECYPVRIGGKVEPMTLKKWARERLEEGIELPPSISIFRITTAKLS